jgi:trk system potassium uptake protein TrkH
MLMWRAITQWVGGMGIIVLSIAVLPMLGAGGVELARAEAPGPEPDRLTPRFRDTAKRLWWIYVGLTVIEAILLSVGEMSLFQGVAHSLTTMPSGGFGTEPDSLASFSSYTHWVVIAFMAITGASFTLHFRALTRPKAYVESKEFLGYIGIVAAGALIIALGTWSLPAATGRTIRDAIFSSLALVTTTGFTTANWAAWAPGVLMVLMVLMFLGGMAGSTAGGMKTYRLGVLYKTIGSSLKRIIYPSIVSVQRFGGKAVEPRLVHGVVAFFILYVGIFCVGATLLAFFEPTLDLVTVASAAASAVGNIGPALGEVGPASNYALLGADSKWLLSFMMVVGRLEIFPVVILLTRRWWRR